MAEPEEVEEGADPKAKESTPPKEEPKRPAAPTQEQVVQAIQYVAQQLQGVIKEVADLKSSKVAPVKQTPVKQEKEVDLEVLSRKELADTILERVREEIVAPVEQRLGETSEERTAQDVRKQIAAAAEANPDFWDWQGEMTEVLKQHPDLNVEEALILARSGSPKKAKDIEGKRNAEADKKAAEETERNRRERFGGLLPTSGVTTKSRRMSPKSAAEKAWDEVGASAHLRAISGE